MFRDREEELRRLEEALQADTDTEPEILPCETEETAPEAETAEQDTLLFSPQDLSRIRNTDRTDVDLEEFSQQVRQEPTKVSRVLTAVLLALTAAAVILGLLILKRYRFF